MLQCTIASLWHPLYFYTSRFSVLFQVHAIHTGTCQYCQYLFRKCVVGYFEKSLVLFSDLVLQVVYVIYVISTVYRLS